MSPSVDPEFLGEGFAVKDTIVATAFPATDISFISTMAENSEVEGADVTKLAHATGYDARIHRRFLNAGIGLGGGCLPRDILECSARAEELGRGAVALLNEIDAINMGRRRRMVDMVVEALGGQVYQKKGTVLSLVFKPYSGDVGHSSALNVRGSTERRGCADDRDQSSGDP